jgi:hypothetical protein
MRDRASFADRAPQAGRATARGLARATGLRSALSQPSHRSPQTTHQASPKRQPARTGRRSPGAFGLIPVWVCTEFGIYRGHFGITLRSKTHRESRTAPE